MSGEVQATKKLSPKYPDTFAISILSSIGNGWIPVFDRSGRANIGHALETAARIELERRGAEVAYVRTDTGFEVDFITRYPDNRQELIQVCSNLDDPATHQRETRASIEAAKEFPKASLTSSFLKQRVQVKRRQG